MLGGVAEVVSSNPTVGHKNKYFSAFTGIVDLFSAFTGIVDLFYLSICILYFIIFLFFDPFSVVEWVDRLGDPAQSHRRVENSKPSLATRR